MIIVWVSIASFLYFSVGMGVTFGAWHKAVSDKLLPDTIPTWIFLLLILTWVIWYPAYVADRLTRRL